jgi:hypothetical protein
LREASLAPRFLSARLVRKKNETKTKRSESCFSREFQKVILVSTLIVGKAESPCQFAANPCGVRTSRLLSPRWEGQPPPPNHATATSPPSGRAGNPSPCAEGEAGRSLRSASTQLPPPCPSASPSHGASGRFSCAGPSLASARSTLLPPSTTATVCIEDFFTLYEQCVASRFKARATISYATGCQEISLSCFLLLSSLAPVAPAAKRRHRHR